jgi:hypothetical protein
MNKLIPVAALILGSIATVSADDSPRAGFGISRLFPTRPGGREWAAKWNGPGRALMVLPNSENKKPMISVYLRHEYGTVEYEKFSIREIDTLVG